MSIARKLGTELVTVRRRGLIGSLAETASKSKMQHLVGGRS